jgi:hypothetical protein
MQSMSDLVRSPRWSMMNIRIDHSSYRVAERWRNAMQEWEKLSSAELRELVQRLYMRLEQYEIHARSLVEGSSQREGAMAVVERMRRNVTNASAILDRRIAEAIGLDAHMQAVRMVQPVAMRDGTLGSSGDRVA